MDWTRRHFVMTGLCATLAPSLARAQEYPSRVINLVSGFPPGAPSDSLARTLAPMLEKVLGQPLVVINRPGAGGIVAMQSVVNAAPDGYTVMLVDTAISLLKSLHEKLNFDPIADFAKVGLAANSQLLLATRTTLPAKTLEELVALAKAKPYGLTYGSPGVGTPPHLCALAFMQKFGVLMTEVQYRGGAPAVSDLMGGHLDVLFAGPSSLAGPAQGGKVRLLVAVGSRRSTLQPEIPTFQELGFDTPELREGAWWGLAVPTKTPRAIVARLNAALQQVLKDPANQTAFDKLSFVPMPSSPEAFDDFVEEQSQFWSKLLADPRFKKKA